MGSELTPAAEQILATLAFEVEQRIKVRAEEMRRGWVELARDLYEFYTATMWTALGHDSFDEWIASPDIDLGRRWTYDLIAMHREYVVNRAVPASEIALINPSKLQMLLPAVRRRQIPVNAALADARVLSRSDLRERYGAQGTGSVQSVNGSAPDMSSHLDADAEPAFIRCYACGSRVKADQMRGDDD